MSATRTRRSGREPVGGEHGAATVWVLSAMCFVLVLAAAGLAVLAAVGARHRAAAAADLGALAGAAAAVRLEAEPCRRADTVVRANGGVLERCELDGADVRVWVRRGIPGPLAGLGPAHARARAGPVDRRGFRR